MKKLTIFLIIFFRCAFGFCAAEDMRISSSSGNVLAVNVDGSINATTTNAPGTALAYSAQDVRIVGANGNVLVINSDGSVNATTTQS